MKALKAVQDAIDYPLPAPDNNNNSSSSSSSSSSGGGGGGGNGSALKEGASTGKFLQQQHELAQRSELARLLGQGQGQGQGLNLGQGLGLGQGRLAGSQEQDGSLLGKRRHGKSAQGQDDTGADRGDRDRDRDSHGHSSQQPDPKQPKHNHHDSDNHNDDTGNHNDDNGNHHDVDDTASTSTTSTLPTYVAVRYHPRSLI